MSGNLKSELSKKNKYWISKHRYLELRHYCLQYYEWLDALKNLNLYPQTCYLYYTKGLNELADPTEELAALKLNLTKKMKDISDCCAKADEYLGPWILIAVTRNVSFEKLKAKYDLACGRDMFYDRYRRFFWLLDKIR